jgi:hypothetical protein
MVRHLFVPVIWILLLSVYSVDAQIIDATLPGVTIQQISAAMESVATADDTDEGGYMSRISFFNTFWTGRVAVNDSSGNDMFAQYHHALKDATLARMAGPCAASGGNWKVFGPNSLSDLQAVGKINSVWADPDDSNYVLAGATGGLFKTTDGGAHWDCITDKTLITGGVIGLNRIAVNPMRKNTIYLATGSSDESAEIDFQIFNGRQFGAGILKSFNGGVTWLQENVYAGSSPGYYDVVSNVQRVFFSPDTNRIYAFREDRIYTRNNNPVGTWVDITPPGYIPDNWWMDMQFVDNSHFFVSNWVRGNHAAVYYANAAVPSASNWTNISAGLTSVIGGTTYHDTDYTRIAISLPNTDTLYAVTMPSRNAGHVMLHKYSLSAHSWSHWGSDMPQFNPSGTKMSFVVSPANPRYMYYGGDMVSMSADWGNTFIEMAHYNDINTHADIRDMCLQAAYDTLHGMKDRLYLATDGGVGKKPSMLDMTLSSSHDHLKDISGYGLATGQFWGIGISDNGELMLGGSQHNGAFSYEHDEAEQWANIEMADVQTADFDNANGQGIFNHNYRKYPAATLVTDPLGTRQMGDYHLATSVLDSCQGYTNDIFIYPDGTRYMGFYKLWQSVFPFSSWSAMDGTYGITNTDTSYIRQMEFSPYASTPVGYILYKKKRVAQQLKYRNPSASVTAFTDRPLPFNTNTRQALCIATDPQHVERVWVGTGIYGPVDSSVVYSPDGGSTWYNVSYGLPGLPVGKMIYHEGGDLLFCTTESGIYRCDFSTFNPSDTAHYNVAWTCFSDGAAPGTFFPNVFVTDLKINYCQGKLYAATYGRSIWETDVFPPGHDAATTEVIASNTTWSGERHEKGSVLVKNGSTLTITGTTIHMPASGVIAVEPGGKLNVNNSTLTNSCAGCLWGGIQAWGNTLDPQDATHQAVVKLNNSVIEYAKVGVRNCNPDPMLSMSGGIIQGISTTFRNNVNDVTFDPYHNMLGSTTLPNMSYFTLCTFKLDNDYRWIPSLTIPTKRVFLQGVEGIAFRGCKFANLYSLYKGWDDGIRAIDAGFSVMPYCSVSGPSGCSFTPTRCSFSGFLNGVYTREIVPSGYPQSVSIDQADFDTVTVGVNISVQKVVSVTRCKFNIGRGINNTFIDTATGLPNACGRNMGIMTQSSLTFRIEENTFTGVTNSFGISPWHNIGVLTIRAGNATNRIYRNSFDHLTYGTLGIGENSPTYPAYPGFGVQVTCNSFNTNTNDIYSGGTYANEGIGIKQMGPNPTYTTSASNTFSGSTKNVVNPNYGRVLDYYYNFSGTLLTSGNVVQYNATNDQCPSKIGVPSGTTLLPSYMTAAVTSVDAAELASYKSAFYNAKASYAAAVADFENTIDLGNTDSVKLVIDTSMDVTKLFQELTAISPYLSADALKEVVAIAGAQNYSDVLDLLAMNPEVIRDYDLLTEMANTLNMGSQDFDDLWATASTVSTARTALEDNMRMAGAAMDENATVIMMALKSPMDTNVSVLDTTFNGVCMDTNSVYYLIDTNSVYASADTVDQWLQNIGTINAEYERVALKYFQGNYSGANNLFTSINTQNLTSEEMAEHNLYAGIWSVMYTAALDGRSFFQLDSAEIATLDTAGIPYVGSSAAKIRISNIRVNPRYDFPCTSAPPASKTVREGRDRRTALGNGYRLRAYPNPSSGIVTFEYTLPKSLKPNEDVRIVVLNVVGEKVMERRVAGNTGKLQWDSQSLPSGVYIYQASNDGGVFGKGKLVLVK